MNSTDRELVLCYLIARDERKCNTKNGHGCNKSFNQLIEESKTNEEQTGKTRKLPVITVDCVDNTNNHRIDIYDSKIMQNFQMLCISCNRKKNPHKPNISQASGRTPSREKLDKLRYEPTYHRNLKTFLQDNQEGCYYEIMINSKTFSGGASQPTCKRYFEDDLLTKVNQKGIYQKFPFDCNFGNCNGVHICLVGMKPEKLIQKERQYQETTWFDIYGSNRDLWKSHTSYSGKPFMEMEEYVESHSQLIGYDFK